MPFRSDVDNTAVTRVGRLVEVRVGAGYGSASDVDALFQAIATATQGQPHKRFVVAADWRLCPIMSADASARAREAMTRNNPIIERSAVLASSESPTAVLQFVRLVRESNNEQRRLFCDRDALVAWLGEVLEAAEMERLLAFLAQGADPLMRAPVRQRDPRPAGRERGR